MKTPGQFSAKINTFTIDSVEEGLLGVRKISLVLEQSWMKGLSVLLIITEWKAIDITRFIAFP